MSSGVCSLYLVSQTLILTGLLSTRGMCCCYNAVHRVSQSELSGICATFKTSSFQGISGY